MKTSMWPGLLRRSRARGAAGFSAAVLVLTGGGTAAEATPGVTAVAPAAAVDDFSAAQGWSGERHVRAVADVDGDGRADVVGFGDAGVLVARGRADGTFSPAVLAVRDFGWAQGWRVDRHPRKVMDVDGDGRADLLGFGDAGVHVAYARADGTFGPAALVVRNFGWAQGWRTDLHVRRAADVDGDGRADLVGFGDAGTYLSRSLPGGTFAPAVLQTMRVGPEMGSRGGWTVEDHPRELADITGDGVAEIIGFSDSSVVVSFFQEPGGFTYPETRGSNFTAGYYGWRGDRHPRVLGDVDGDRLADIVGFGYAGTWIATASRPDGIPNGWFDEAELRSSSFGYDGGWRVELHPRAVADVTGDGRDDVVGFGDAGVYAAESRADGTLAPASLVVGDFGVAQGWRVGEHPRELADVNGDGRADIVGFGVSRTYVRLL